MRAPLLLTLVAQLAACSFFLGESPGGEDNEALLSFIPMDLNLGQAMLERKSAPGAITVVALDDTPILETSTDLASFEIESDECAGRALIRGQTCMMQISFIPDSEGVASGELHVGTQTAGLTGEGLVDSGLNLTPVASDFGQVVVGQQPTQEYELENKTGQDVTNIDVRTILINGLTDYFSVVDSCDSLEHEDRCPITLTYAPATPGNHGATISVIGLDDRGEVKTVASASGQAVDQFTLVVEIEGDGAASMVPPGAFCTKMGTNCMQSYTPEAMVRVTPTGVGFIRFEGSCMGMGDCDLTMDSNKVVRVVFMGAVDPG